MIVLPTLYNDVHFPSQLSNFETKSPSLFQRNGQVAARPVAASAREVARCLERKGKRRRMFVFFFCELVDLRGSIVDCCLFSFLSGRIWGARFFFLGLLTIFSLMSCLIVLKFYLIMHSDHCVWECIMPKKKSQV